MCNKKIHELVTDFYKTTQPFTGLINIVTRVLQILLKYRYTDSKCNRKHCKYY